MLLGLTHDVDAAVVRSGSSSGGSIVAEHVATVPALAYVAAGKVQRRAVLFGQPGAVLPASLAASCKMQLASMASAKPTPVMML